MDKDHKSQNKEILQEIDCVLNDAYQNLKDNIFSITSSIEVNKDTNASEIVTDLNSKMDNKINHF
jgi:hypothetical protein